MELFCEFLGGGVVSDFTGVAVPEFDSFWGDFDEGSGVVILVLECPVWVADDEFPHGFFGDV